MSRDKLKLKIINKILKELSESIPELHLKLSESQLTFLVNQFLSHKTLIVNKDDSCLDKIKFFQPLTKLTDWDNLKDKVWEYIHQLFFVAVKDKVPDTEFTQLKKDAEEDVQVIQTPKASSSTDVKNDLFSIVNEITQDLVGQIKGSDMHSKIKNMNPSQIMEALVSGKKVNGIDFTKMISEVSKKVETKLKEKNIDETQLEDQVETLTKDLNLTELTSFLPKNKK
jgi:hypothetical protein